MKLKNTYKTSETTIYIVNLFFMVGIYKSHALMEEERQKKQQEFILKNIANPEGNRSQRRTYAKILGKVKSNNEQHHLACITQQKLKAKKKRRAKK
ncbi:MAG: hypothetical protein PHU93_01215 [Candidatus Gracilibacteria bacterium]|nr:hypothetical protein [Candidatus Gracilibacteria bacterium]